MQQNRAADQDNAQDVIEELETMKLAAAAKLLAATLGPGPATEWGTRK